VVQTSGARGGLPLQAASYNAGVISAELNARGKNGMAKRNTKASSNASGWTSTQAYVMAIICLLVGVAVGYLLRGSAISEAQPVVTAGAASTGGVPFPVATGGMRPQLSPDQLKQIADAQAAPLLERLKSEPNNAQLLAEIGNLYYDSRQYQLAVDYYQRSLKIQPRNSNVRTDLGTTLWYLGDADKAIEQFKTVLKTEPTKANALMNLGVVEWQGKMDVPAALAAWEKLLATNPNFEEKNKVEHLMAEAKKHSDIKPGARRPM
jgi:cytochrome c-type biogenesis protein CcmH/NrfG